MSTARVIPFTSDSLESTVTMERYREAYRTAAKATEFAETVKLSGILFGRPHFHCRCRGLSIESCRACRFPGSVCLAGCRRGLRSHGFSALGRGISHSRTDAGGDHRFGRQFLAFALECATRPGNVMDEWRGHGTEDRRVGYPPFGSEQETCEAMLFLRTTHQCQTDTSQDVYRSGGKHRSSAVGKVVASLSTKRQALCLTH